METFAVFAARAVYHRSSRNKERMPMTGGYARAYIETPEDRTQGKVMVK